MVKMEKGANSSNGLSTWDKKSSSNSGHDVAHSMKLHSTEAFLSKGFMTGTNLDRPFDGGTAAGGGGGSMGPTGSTLGGANEEMLSNINRDDAAAYTSSSSCDAAANLAKSSSCNSSTNLQPFDMFPPAYSTAPFKSPGGMAATVGFPFTSAQWGELQRQAMIYKYMMCSVPVPTELLFPLTKSYPAPVDSSASSLYNVRYSRNGDPEPGRCKRTDGKKWRCSRDVAPHQKYCERHLHRGRPRSRKPVEVKSNGESHKKTRLEQGRPVPLPSSVPAPAPAPAATSQQVVASNKPPLLLFNPKPDASISAVDGLSYKGANRELGLISMEAGMVNMNGDDQRWQLLMGPNMGFGGDGSSIYGSSPLFDQDYVEQQPPLNVFAYTNASEEAPAGFIDAWSVDYSLNTSNNGNTGSTNQGSHSPSLNLSMAMAIGNILDQGMEKVQFEGSIECHNEHSSKNSANWLGPGSWLPFAQGGPLAEALQPGANPASPHDSIGTPATTVSSPSGVLQRSFFSHSDSSVCNSPTFAAAHASEVAFPRFNQMD